jgi:hypothetical protein
MQDYPEDSGKGMSQVFNGTKMLLDMPSPPAVWVHGSIYITDKLLQDSTRGYFIPQWFFLGAADLPWMTPKPVRTLTKYYMHWVKLLNGLMCVISASICTITDAMQSPKVEWYIPFP